MADRATLARLWRAAPFAAVAMLGLGVLIVPEPDRSAANPTPAAIAAIGPAGGEPLEVAVAVTLPAEVASPTVSLTPVAALPARPVTTTTAVPRPTTTATSVASAESLRIGESGWSSATGAGTPAGTAGIPKDSLPVGARPGGPDKVSWFRLAGAGASLVLQPVSDSGANRFEADAVIRLCRSTVSDWATGANLDPAETPPYNDTHCADGERAEDGSWSFDLTRLGPVDDERGAVLVPGDGLFQITFARQGET